MYTVCLVHVLRSIVNVQGSTCRPQYRPRLHFRPPCICLDSFRLSRLLRFCRAVRWRSSSPVICPSPLVSSALPAFSLIAFYASSSDSETKFSPVPRDKKIKVVINFSVHATLCSLQDRWLCVLLAYLCFWEAECCGQLHALRCWEVPLHFKALFQPGELRVREYGARFPAPAVFPRKLRVMLEQWWHLHSFTRKKNFLK